MSEEEIVSIVSFWHTQSFSSHATAQQEQEEEVEKNFFAFISFLFFWLLMLLNCGKSLAFHLESIFYKIATLLKLR